MNAPPGCDVICSPCAGYALGSRCGAGCVATGCETAGATDGGEGVVAADWAQAAGATSLPGVVLPVDLAATPASWSSSALGAALEASAA
eukprot:3993070-Pleurochrysis_carterae.AAC.1